MLTARTALVVSVAIAILLASATTASAATTRVHGDGYSLTFTLPTGFYVSDENGSGFDLSARHRKALDVAGTILRGQTTATQTLHIFGDHDIRHVSGSVWCGLSYKVNSPDCARTFGTGAITLSVYGATRAYGVALATSLLKSVTGRLTNGY